MTCENMTTPENGIIILHRVDDQLAYRKNGRTPTVAIYEDGTACEGQSVPPGWPCYWTGFNKLTGEFQGRPIKAEDLEII